MPLLDMMAELRGSVPKLPFAYTRTLINRAWDDVRRKNLWSFQLMEFAWISPPLITAGAATVIQGTSTVTFDATAQAALVSLPYSLLTQRQFRVSAGGIYNILAYDDLTGTATLDRMFADPTVTAGTYQVYQVYYTPPVRDFRMPFSVRNLQMFIDLNLTTTRAEIDALDPQRTWLQFPSRVVPWGTDQRGAGTASASATLGYPLYEFWGQPISPFTYQCYGIRNGADLVGPDDTLPFSVTEELVLAKARELAYEWAEANKSMEPRAVGPDFKFLMGKAHDDYRKLLARDRMLDRDIIDNWFVQRRDSIGQIGLGYYNTLLGVAGVGIQQ